MNIFTKVLKRLTLFLRHYNIHSYAFGGKIIVKSQHRGKSSSSRIEAPQKDKIEIKEIPGERERGDLASNTQCPLHNVAENKHEKHTFMSFPPEG